MTPYVSNIHNRFSGYPAFVIGSGPSLNLLNPADLEQLIGRWTFGLNFLPRWSGLPFLPNFWCVDEWPALRSVDELLRLTVLEHENDEWVNPPRWVRPTRFYYHSWELPNAPSGWHFIRGDDNLSLQNGGWSGCIEGELEPVAAGSGSVATTAIQMACYMGFDPIYLLGCDASRAGHVWPDLVDVERGRQDGFQRAILTVDREMRKRGRTLVDLSEGGDLPLGVPGLKTSTLAEVIPTLKAVITG